jgi:uncharacterized phage protein (TIGR02220 family)
MNHSFNVSVAVVVGVLPATIFNSIGFWVTTNMANENNCFDGKYWVYNTVSAWTDLFPYATKKQVERALGKLRDADLIETGCFNEDKRDRTLWYTLSSLGWSMYGPPANLSAGDCNSPHGEPRFPIGGNDYINTTVSNTVGNTDSFLKTVEEIISYLNERSGKKFRSSSKQTRSLINARLRDGYTIEDFRHVIDVKCSQWRGDAVMDRYLKPGTLFAPSHFEGYVNEMAPNTNKFSEKYKEYDDYVRS